MALSLPGLELIDPFDGLGDLLERKVLRTPIAASESFADDPLRMLRAARFVAGYGLAARSGRDSPRRRHERCHERFDEIVAAERVRDELDKLPRAARPVRRALVHRSPHRASWAQFLPELPALALEEDPVHRHKDVLAHTIAVVREDLARTASPSPRGAPPRHPASRGPVPMPTGQECPSTITTSSALAWHDPASSALRYPSAVIDDVSRLVELHLRFHTYSMGWTDSALRRYARDAGDLLGLLNELTRADCTTRNERKVRELELRMDELEERLAAQSAEREALEQIRPELDGEEVMAHLGIGPGRDVGRALDFLLEVRLEDGLLGKDEAARRLDSWWERARPVDS